MANYARDLIYNFKHKQTGGRKHDYRIYKKNHPDIPKDVMGMYNLSFLGGRKRLSATEIISTYQKGERLRANCRGKRVQQESFCKKDSIRTYHLRNKKVQENE